jgi:hypothetical protein
VFCWGLFYMNAAYHGLSVFGSASEGSD